MLSPGPHQQEISSEKENQPYEDERSRDKPGADSPRACLRGGDWRIGFLNADGTEQTPAVLRHALAAKEASARGAATGRFAKRMIAATLQGKGFDCSPPEEIDACLLAV